MPAGVVAPGLRAAVFGLPVVARVGQPAGVVDCPAVPVVAASGGCLFPVGLEMPAGVVAPGLRAAPPAERWTRSVGRPFQAFAQQMEGVWASQADHRFRIPHSPMGKKSAGPALPNLWTRFLVKGSRVALLFAFRGAGSPRFEATGAPDAHPGNPVPPNAVRPPAEVSIHRFLPAGFPEGKAGYRIVLPAPVLGAFQRRPLRGQGPPGRFPETPGVARRSGFRQ